MRLDTSNVNLCIVVTGLPGSGKTTVGRNVARHLNFSFLDKDDYLEALFEERGIGDLIWRQSLSRESDLLFQRDAAREKAVVLVSHWRPESSEVNSGTPTTWLAQKFSRIIELYCPCPVDVAAKRYIDRKRHSGHLDGMKTPNQVAEWLTEYDKHLPMLLGSLVSTETDLAEPFQGIIGSLNEVLQSDA